VSVPRLDQAQRKPPAKADLEKHHLLIDGFDAFRFGIHFEGQVGAMLASKIDQKPGHTAPNMRLVGISRPEATKSRKIASNDPLDPRFD